MLAKSQFWVCSPDRHSARTGEGTMSETSGDSEAQSNTRGPLVELKAHTCSVCGRLPSNGSLTAWIFQTNRCQCPSRVQTTETDKAQEPLPAREIAANLTTIEQPESLPEISLGERYEVLARIGEGGSGQVYRVFDKELKLPFAVKLLRPEVARDPVMKQRFLQESKLAMTLTHENLVGMYGQNETPDGTPFIVMDYLEGRSLEAILKEEGPLSEDRFMSIFSQTLEGLSHAHMKGLIHRDLKPANILIVEPQPGVEIVKLIDFGIAKLTETSLRTTHNLTQTGEVFGTPAYMSPEQCLGFEVDQRSDIYSLGCLMYEALSGSAPFSGKNAVQIISKHLGAEPFMPKGDNYQLNNLIVSCLAKEVSERPQSAEKLLAKLRLIESGSLRSPVLFNVSRQLKNLLRSKNNNILPNMRFYYGASGIAMWATLITGIAAALPSAVRNAPDPLVYFCCSAVVLLTHFALVEFRARIRYVSQVVETTKPQARELDLINKTRSGYAIKFSGLPIEDYTADGVNLEDLTLPFTCDVWSDETDKVVAVQVNNALLLRNIWPYAIRHISWWKILLTICLLSISCQPLSSSPVLLVLSEVSLVLLIVGGLLRGWARRDWLLTGACFLSLPIVVSIVGNILQPFLSSSVQLLVIQTLNLPHSYPAVLALSMMVMWSFVGLFKLLEYTGLLKVGGLRSSIGKNTERSKSSAFISKAK